MPDEVGEGLVERPAVGVELGSVIVARAKMICIFAQSCQSSRVHVFCSLSKWEWKVTLLTHTFIFTILINNKLNLYLVCVLCELKSFY